MSCRIHKISRYDRMAHRIQLFYLWYQAKREGDRYLRSLTRLKDADRRTVKTHVYTLCYNEEKFLPFFLQHYSFADSVYLYDNYSTDNSVAIAKSFNNVRVRSFDSKDAFDDRYNLEIKNEAWKESRGKCDFVIVCDCDELLYHPIGLGPYLEALRILNPEVSFIPSLGFQMFGDRDSYEPSKSILEQLPYGLPLPHYNKSLVFDPDRIEEINYELGAHDCSPQGVIHASAPLFLLHYHYIWSRESILERHTLLSKRLSSFNREKQHGKQYFGDLEMISSYLDWLEKEARYRIV